jgi:predicted nucleic acid-binding protein
MTVAIDSNILFDLLVGDSEASSAARQVLLEATGLGRLVISPAVYAELAAGFGDRRELEEFLHDFGIQLATPTPEALWRAAEAWIAYTRQRGRSIQCPGCGQRIDVQCPACHSPLVWRQHLITDFLIGGHALADADMLLTRDRGYYRTYFPQLKIVAPG